VFVVHHKAINHLYLIVRKLITVNWVTEPFSIRQIYTFAVLFLFHEQWSYYTKPREYVLAHQIEDFTVYMGTIFSTRP